jgi:hypothetical protein
MNHRRLPSSWSLGIAPPLVLTTPQQAQDGARGGASLIARPTV